MFRIFLLFFWNFLLPVGSERNETLIFIFSLCQPFPTYFGLKRSHNRVFLIFWIFFLFFFGIFYYMFCGNETEQQFLFSLFVSLFQPILAWKGAIIGFFNVLKIFAIFLEFSFTRWVGTKRNFYFVYFSAFSNLFWLKMRPQWCYLIFWFFFFFFWNFLLPVG